MEMALAALELQQERSDTMRSIRIAMLVIVLLICFTGAVFAQEEAKEQAKKEAEEEFQEEVLEEVEEGKKNDNTGTNPINFTYDARFYIETSWLDGGSLIAPTFEFRAPLGRDLYNLTNQPRLCRIVAALALFVVFINDPVTGLYHTKGVKLEGKTGVTRSNQPVVHSFFVISVVAAETKFSPLIYRKKIN